MSQNDFVSVLDRPEIINFLFYPRKEAGWDLPEFAENFDVYTHDGILIG